MKVWDPVIRKSYMHSENLKQPNQKKKQKKEEEKKKKRKTEGVDNLAMKWEDL